MRSLRHFVFNTTVLLSASGAQAAADFSDKLAIRFSANTEYTDNIFKTDANKKSERQDTFGAFINTQHNTDSAELLLDLGINHHTFSKDSEDSETSVEGLAQITAQLNRHLEAKAYINRKVVVSNPKQQTLISNTDEKTITGLDLKTSFDITPVDEFTLTPQASLVSYEDAPDLESKRLGINTQWTHRLSPISDIIAGYTYSEIEYDSSQNDQTYERGYIGYNSSLRILEYSVEAGYNLINPSKGNHTYKPFYRFDIDYDGGVHKLNISGSSIITDSSLGDGNIDPISADTTTAGSSEQLDQLTQDELSITYTFDQLCSTCFTGIDATWLQEEYLTLLSQNLEEYALSAFIQLQTTPRSSLNLRLTQTDVAFEFDSVSDYQETTTLLDFKYQLNPQMNAGIFTRYEKRDSNNQSLRYSELRGGLSLNYEL